MTTRLDHTNCEHPTTPAGRKACRAGDALLRQAEPMNLIRVGGVAYSVRQVTNFYTSPAEALVSTWSLDNGWTSLGWMPATTFAGGTLVTD